jgi:hypothetical protein
MRWTALRSVISKKWSRPIGCLHPARVSSFPKGAVGFHFLPSPITCAMGSSSRELRLLYRVLRSYTRPLPCGSGLPSWGSLSPSRHQPWQSTTRELPKPASFRPRGFSPPRRLTPALALRVYFTPQPRPGFSLQGLPLERSRTISSMAVALVTFNRTLCRLLAQPTPKIRPRLQGLAPRPSPLPDVCR